MEAFFPRSRKRKKKTEKKEEERKTLRSLFRFAEPRSRIICRVSITSRPDASVRNFYRSPVDLPSIPSISLREPSPFARSSFCQRAPVHNVTCKCHTTENVPRAVDPLAKSSSETRVSDQEKTYDRWPTIHRDLSFYLCVAQNEPQGNCHFGQKWPNFRILRANFISSMQKHVAQTYK